MQSTDERVGDEIHRRIATAIGVSREDVALMDARLSGPDMSLNAPIGDDGDASAERVDFLVDNAPLPDETVSDAVDGERRLTWLRQALTVLSERELRILHERRLAEDQATLEALGHRLGISKGAFARSRTAPSRSCAGPWPSGSRSRMPG